MSCRASSSAGTTKSNSHRKKIKCLKEVLRWLTAPTSSSWEKWWQYMMAKIRNILVYRTLMDAMKVFGKGVAVKFMLYSSIRSLGSRRKRWRNKEEGRGKRAHMPWSGIRFRCWSLSPPTPLHSLCIPTQSKVWENWIDARLPIYTQIPEETQTQLVHGQFLCRILYPKSSLIHWRSLPCLQRAIRLGLLREANALLPSNPHYLEFEE
jgi:hypothetical protein